MRLSLSYEGFCSMGKHRLKKRRLRIWRADYLTCKYLWRNIERMIRLARDTAETPCPLVLDVGCGHKPYRECFGNVRYLGMDFTAEDSSPDFLGNACKIPVRTGSVDIVLCTQVIEHVPEPAEMLSELHRVLRPGGYLILTGPMYWPLHEEPFDFYRFTKYGFMYLLKKSGFSSSEILEDGGDWAQILLALNLRLEGSLAAPLRCAINAVGVVLNMLSTSKVSPANYTIWARR
jgi:SAM-dependent methyltransferase